MKRIPILLIFWSCWITVALSMVEYRPLTSELSLESCEHDIQDRTFWTTNLDNQTMTVTYGVGSMVKSVTRLDGSTGVGSVSP